MHKHRLIHRDLKPGNIFMNSPEDVKIGDFGLVKSIAQLVDILEEPNDGVLDTNALTIFNSSNYCTKLYASPEQLDSSNKINSFDHRIDTHALGLIILQLFHPMNTQMEVIKTIQDARKGILPKSLTIQHKLTAEAILNCLNRDPNLRPSLESLIQDVCGMNVSGSSTTTTSNLDSPDKQIIEFSGLVQVKFEGSTKYKPKYLIIYKQ